MSPTSASETRQSVFNLLAEYCVMLDSGRFEDWTAPRRAAPRGIHLCGLPVVSVTADAVSSTRPWNFVDVATGTQVVRYYHDDIDRSEGRHRFRSRRIEMHFPPVRKE